MEHFNVHLNHFIKRQTFCGWEIPLRCISDYEIVFIASGEGDILINQTHFHAVAGDFFLFKPGIPHSLKVSRMPCMNFYAAHFTPPNHSDMILPDYLHLNAFSRFTSLFKSLMHTYREFDSFSLWRRNLLLEQILCELASAFYLKNESLGAKKIRKILSLIHENPYRKYSIAQLTKIAGMQKTAFIESFRTVTGTTPLQYITTLQMEEARELLWETKLTVNQIAEQCGFTDVFYFSRCFKKHFSLSPKKYRIAYLSNGEDSK